jgi:FkbM family methyltransferase
MFYKSEVNEKKTFYSQDKQDEILETHIFKGYRCGYFVNIGANDGKTIDNTLYFEETNGWNGINIEPIPETYQKLILNRPHCINLNCAIDTENGEAEFLCNKGYTEMISGLTKYYDYRHDMRRQAENHHYGSHTEKIMIPTRTLESIFDEYKIKEINFISIDVEGAEFSVIKSINFDKVFVDVIIFENNYPDVSIPIIEYLQNKGFLQLNREGMDIIMAHKNSKFLKL